MGWLKRNRRYLAFWLIASAALVAILGTAASYQKCVGKAYHKGAEQQLPESLANLGIAIVFKCPGVFVSVNADSVIAAFTIILGIATWLLWRATRDLVHEARKTGADQIAQATALAEATQKAADAAKRSADTSIGLTVAFFPDIRVQWSRVDRIKYGPDQLRQFLQTGSVRISVRNFGQTHAHPPIICATCGFIGRELPPKPNYEGATIGLHQGTISPIGKGERGDWDVSHPLEVLVDLEPWIENILGERTSLWVFGYLQYDDFLGVRHKQGFACKMRVELDEENPRDTKFVVGRFYDEAPAAYKYRT